MPFDDSHKHCRVTPTCSGWIYHSGPCTPWKAPVPYRYVGKHRKPDEPTYFDIMRKMTNDPELLEILNRVEREEAEWHEALTTY